MCKEYVLIIIQKTPKRHDKDAKDAKRHKEDAKVWLRHRNLERRCQNK